MDIANQTDGKDLNDPLLAENTEKIPPSNKNEISVEAEEHPSLLQELLGVVCSPVCMLVIAGYSQYTAVTAGFAFYGECVEMIFGMFCLY